MKFKCIIGLLVLLPAVLAKPSVRDIPVKVIYEDPKGLIDDLAEIKLIESSRNLNEKIQLSPAELVKPDVYEVSATGLKKVPVSDAEVISNGASSENLNEKVQLSSKELPESVKHIPFPEKEEKLEKVEKVVEKEVVAPEVVVKSAVEGASPGGEQVKPVVPVPVISAKDFFVRARLAINQQLFNLRRNAPNQPDDKNRVSEENWKSLNSSIDSLFKSFEQESAKQEPLSQNIFQQFYNRLQTIGSRFTDGIVAAASSITNPNNNPRPDPGSSNDQSPPANQNQNQNPFFNYIQTSFQSMYQSVSNLFSFNNPSTPASVLGDEQPAVPTTPANIVVGFVNQVQSLFGITTRKPEAPNQNDQQPLSQPVPQAPQAPQPPQTPQAAPAPPPAASTQPPAQGPFGFIQNAANQFGQAVNSFIAPSTAAPPGGSQEDESPASPGPLQNLGNQVNQFVSGIFNRATPPPAQLSQASSTSGPILSAFNQIGQFVNNIGRPSTPPTRDQATTLSPAQAIQLALNESSQTNHPPSQTVDSPASEAPVNQTVDNRIQYDSLPSNVTEVKANVTVNAENLLPDNKPLVNLDVVSVAATSSAAPPVQEVSSESSSRSPEVSSVQPAVAVENANNGANPPKEIMIAGE